jgi:hypothetical protein
MAVCLLPGTELAFETPIKYQTALMFRTHTGRTVAIFRQINRGVLDMNHDALDYVNKILRGAKPADIPVEQPTDRDL